MSFEVTFNVSLRGANTMRKPADVPTTPPVNEEPAAYLIPVEPNGFVSSVPLHLLQDLADKNKGSYNFVVAPNSYSFKNRDVRQCNALWGSDHFEFEPEKEGAYAFQFPFVSQTNVATGRKTASEGGSNPPYMPKVQVPSLD